MIYMNNGATSYPKPDCVAEAMAACVRALPGAANRSMGGVAETESCRTYLARLMKISDETRIVYAMNATMALNMALLGFPWKQGDMVISTTAEHNSVLRPLYKLKKEGVIDYVLLPVEKDGRVSERVFLNALKQYRPRMAVLTHASNVTGGVHDVQKMAVHARAHHCVFLLDASQTLGMIPVYPERWGIDMAAFTGHKYLLGPQGTGGLYVSPQIALHPVLVGGTGIHSDEEEMPAHMPLHLEAGTPNEPSFAGLLAALKWGEEHPVDLRQTLLFIKEIKEKLKQWGYQVTEAEGDCTPVLSFASPVYTPEEMGDILLQSYDIICRTGLHCAPKILEGIGADRHGTVRISLSRFTTQEEVDVLLQALEEMGKDHVSISV